MTVRRSASVTVGAFNAHRPMCRICSARSRESVGRQEGALKQLKQMGAGRDLPRLLRRLDLALK